MKGGEQKFWTWLILGLIAVFVVFPFVGTLLSANSKAIKSGVSAVLGFGLIAAVVLGGLWVLVAVLGGGSGGKQTGARALAEAERAKVTAIEQVRYAHSQRMYTERADNARAEAEYRAALLKARAEKDGRWMESR